MNQRVKCCRAVMCVMMLGCMTGCGEGYSEVVGTYEGTVELYNAVGFSMVTQVELGVISILPVSQSESEVWVGLSGECVLRGVLQGERGVTVTKQACQYELQNASDEWFYEGSGEVSEEGVLTLTLSGEFTRTFKLGPLFTPPPVNGLHRMSFTGKRY